MDLITEFASPLVFWASIFMAAVSRWTLVDRHGGFGGFVRGLTASITISFILYYSLGEMDVPQGFRLAIVAAASFMAEDILMSVRAIVLRLREDPAGFLMRIIAAIFKKD